jgi:sporulation protein YlmC with PRC-barrel domain
VIRFSDIHNNPVISTTSATTVGKVASVVIDPSARSVAAFRVKKSKGSGDTLLWTAITAIGPDAVTVDSEDRLIDPPQELEDRCSVDLEVVGHRVLDDAGRELGTVQDVEFDPDDGALVTLMLKDAYVKGERLLGIGRYAVVVTA